MFYGALKHLFLFLNQHFYWLHLHLLYISTHIDNDIKCVIIGQKNTDTAAVLHGFVVVEVQFVHLRVAGTGQALPPATGALGPLTTRLHHHRHRLHHPVAVALLQLQPSTDTPAPTGSAGQAALTKQGMGTRAEVSHCRDTSERTKDVKLVQELIILLFILSMNYAMAIWV